MKMYRYEPFESKEEGLAWSTIRLRLVVFNVVKQTPKGCYVSLFSHFDKNLSVWVSHTGERRYAYPTEEEAMVNLVKRTELSLLYLQARVLKSKTILEASKNKDLQAYTFNIHKNENTVL